MLNTFLVLSYLRETDYDLLRYFNFEPSFKLHWCVLQIYLDHKLQWPQGSLNWKSLAYEIFNNPLWPSGLGNNFICKRFAVQTLLWSHGIITWMAIQTHPFIASQKRQLTSRRCTKIGHTIKSCPLNFANVWYPANTAIRDCCR